MSITTILQPRSPIAIIRLDDLTHAVEIARALLAGGISELEFTLTNKHALDALKSVRLAFGDAVVVGAGTVVNEEMAHASVRAGAQFLVTPIVAPGVVEVGLEHNVPVVCGAFTPTEIFSAWNMGADLVKVFPSGPLGPAYIKDILAPLPDILLVPTGGVNLQNCRQFLEAGAYSVAIGSSLIDKELVRAGDWAALEERARQYAQACL